jgi:hypothetical protein
VTIAEIRRAITQSGLAFRGAFHPTQADFPAESRAGTIVLVGMVGRENWRTFEASPEFADRLPDPLDRWSRSTITRLAERLAARAVFPFEGPPFMPFQRWAEKADTLYTSPLGILIHPEYGLWHSWRGALIFDDRLSLPPKSQRPNPCEACKEKPCLSACPVGAFDRSGYDVGRCVAHIGNVQGRECVAHGCLARRACPIGVEYRYSDDELAFHMSAFLKAQNPHAPPIGSSE